MDRSGRKPARRALRRVGLGLLTLLVVGVVAVLLLWRPLPSGAAASRAWSSPPAGVTARDTPAALELAPSGRPRSGLVFQPGARVDPHAYVGVLAPLAAEGHLVLIVKQPLNVGFLAADAPTALVAAHPEVDDWTVGGHSLGGVVASEYVRSHPDGPRKLLLWASYPANSLADADVEVASISGSQDGLSSPAEIEDSRAKLPPDTVFTVVEGANHAAFGDYGPQDGDGRATIPAEQAQDRIREASKALLDAVSP